MKIKFLGAVRTVSGSKYLLSIQDKYILVDCGLFQGLKKLRLKNWQQLPISPSDISAVVITHAHIDHTGYLPRLIKDGYTGPIYSTLATYDLCRLLLPDSGCIQEEDAARANKYGYTKHSPALPLYTRADGENALKQFVIKDFNKQYEIFDNCFVKWHKAGHILGASFVRLLADNNELLFSGDIGRFNDPVMKPPEFIDSADYLILESTYGDRLHKNEPIIYQLGKIINKTIKQDGTVLIPAFAVGRAQSILYFIYQLKKQKIIPDIAVYLDSPMAIHATDLLTKHSSLHKLTIEECDLACNVAKYVNSTLESKSIDTLGPKIIVSASGMMTGGRILHHIKYYGSDPRNTILITGYQSIGTRGYDLLNGKKQIKIHGETINITANIDSIEASAHADYQDILYWLQNFKKPPKKVFITHGELESSLSLKEKIENNLGWKCYIPHYLEELELN